MNQLTDWNKQEPFYENKIESIKSNDNSQKFTWSIFLKDTNTVIGQMTCQPKDDEPDDIRDIGWFIDPKYQGNGYATEAAIAMIDFMLNEVEISKIITSSAEINSRSWKILEKLGFKYIDTIKSSYYKVNEILMLKEYFINKELFNNRNV